MEKRYFKLQLKRAFKVYPAVLFITILTLCAVALTSLLLIYDRVSGEEKQRLAVGIVGNIDDSYLGIGLTALQNMDSSRFYIDWLELSEEEAVRALEAREIHGYVVIPDNYIETIYHGENTPAEYIMLNGPEGFGSIVASEIAETLSDIVVECQNGMYAMQDLAKDYDRKNLSKNEELLLLQYIRNILNRSEAYEVDVIGIADSCSFGGYYVCGILLLFVMLWGIACNKLFTSRNQEYSSLLNASGISPKHQILCEYGAYLSITLMTLIIVAFLVGVALQFVDTGIPELLGLRVFDAVGFIFKILLVIIMLTWMQTAFYELIPNAVAAVLMQFILTIVLGYISGCFYPNYFFPEALQKIAAILPVGVGFSYIRKAMTGLPSLVDTALVVCYTAAFYVLTLFLKKRRIEGLAK